jgi:hypothetical protein
MLTSIQSLANQKLGLSLRFINTIAQCLCFASLSYSGSTESTSPPIRRERQSTEIEGDVIIEHPSSPNEIMRQRRSAVKGRITDQKLSRT